MKHIDTTTRKLEASEKRVRSVFGPTPHTMGGCSRLKGEQNKTDIFLSVYGVMHSIKMLNKPADLFNESVLHVVSNDTYQCHSTNYERDFSIFLLS